MSTWPDPETQKRIDNEVWVGRMTKKINSVFHQIAEIDIEHSNFGTPSRVKVVHQDLNEIIDTFLAEDWVNKSDIPPKRNLDPEDDLSLSYQHIKSDILKIANWYGVDVLSQNITQKSPQINVQVIQSNVQDVKNVAEVINTINISDIKKDEIKKLFTELERTAKDKEMSDPKKNSKLRELFKGIVDLSLDAGIVGLRWAHENGIINRLFGSHQ
ncbi:protein of unknown function [Nitrosotalea devaniterrae]|uniref:AbiTii domain-containing protein n=1 Tax=Nitrosotalea devaniterrae TaxID=1078905 RepID=A0A128A3X6_9ARCH|nr:protein of unknown function [Candidatus Nitrosotalea devanaterra]